MSALRDWLSGTFAGRALIIGTVVKSVTLALGLVQSGSALVETLDTLGDICLVAGAAVLAYRLFVVTKRRLLWRVRRRLTLSYIFIGVVPALLIITFFLVCGVLVVFNLSSYLMQARVRGVVDEAQFLAQTAALELQGDADLAAFTDTLQRRQAGAASRYPAASYVVVPVNRTCTDGTPSREREARALPQRVMAGPWAHLDPPLTLPSWVTCGGHAGLIAYTEGDGRHTARRARGRVTRQPRARIRGRRGRAGDGGAGASAARRHGHRARTDHGADDERRSASAARPPRAGRGRGAARLGRRRDVAPAAAT